MALDPPVTFTEGVDEHVVIFPPAIAVGELEKVKVLIEALLPHPG